MIDLNPKHLETIQRILAEHVPKCEVRAFGSRVKWTAKDYSDLDIAVVGSAPLSLRQLRQLIEAFEESDVPIRVDVADWQSLSDGFKQVIAAEYEVIQKAVPVKGSGQFGGIYGKRDMMFDFPDGWQFRSIENSMKAIIDYRGKTPRKTLFGVPLITAKIVKDGRIMKPDEFIAPEDYDLWMRRGMPEPGDVVMTTEAPLGEVAQLDGRQVALAQRLITLRGKSDLINNTYLKFAMQSAFVQNQLKARSTGTTVLGIRQSELKKVEIPVPSLDEQNRIAHILSAFDEKIELNRQMNETLEVMARAIFKSWFVDFDPVRAKMEGRQPAGMDTETAVLFPSAFQDSPLGKIPKGWKVGTLGEIAENVRRNVKASEINSNECYIGLEHMPRRSIALSEWQTADEIGSNKHRFRKGEILFGKLRPYFYKVGVAPIEGVCSTDILVIQPIYSEWFGIILGLASSDEFIAYTNAYSAGTRMPRTNWKDMSRYETALPQIEVAQKYTEFIRPFIERIIENIHQSRILAQIRDALLPKLLSGEIRVDDVDERLEAI